VKRVRALKAKILRRILAHYVGIMVTQIIVCDGLKVTKTEQEMARKRLERGLN